MTLTEYAMTFLGTPYVWGGNTPEQGFDCSGYVCEILRSDGKIGREDMTAQQIYNEFIERAGSFSTYPKKESLVFYGSSTLKITHVAFGISDTQVIEAGGEGRQATDKGFVRIRPYNYRGDLVASINL